MSGIDIRDSDDPPSPGLPPVEGSNPTPQKDLVKVDVSCQRPGEDMSATEDGPLFRATMKSLEQKTGSMKQRMKKVLKKAEAAHMAQMECNEAISGFMEASLKICGFPCSVRTQRILSVRRIANTSD